MTNPTPVAGQNINDYSYVKKYSSYVNGWITPEYGFWRQYNGLGDLQSTDLDAATE